MKRTFFTLIVSLFLVLGLSACDGDSNGDDNPGPGQGGFSADVEGDLDLALSGTAGFGVGQNLDTGTQGFALAMTSTTGAGAGAVISFGIAGSGRPGSGTYSIVNYLSGPSDIVGEVVGFLQFGGNTYVSTGGTFTVTGSSENNLEGRFTMTASTVTAEGLPPAMTITVDGEFDAFGVDVVDKNGW